MSTGVARSTDPNYQSVLEQYAAGMKLYGQQKFERAKPLLEKVCESQYRELAERAGVHLRACNQRLDGAAIPQSADEFYQAALVKLNAAQFADAEELLNKAIKQGHKTADLSYALACLRAQTRDPEAALHHLQEAIAADPHCRMLARQDHDFEALAEDPRFTEVLYPESGN